MTQTVNTSDLQPSMTVRYPSSTVWIVTGRCPIDKNRYGEKSEVTLVHGTLERKVVTYDFTKWILATSCAPQCNLSGVHTGR